MKREKINDLDAFEFPQPGFIGRILSAILVSVVINGGLAWLVSPLLQDTLLHPLGLPNSLEITFGALLFMVTLIPFLLMAMWLFLHAEITGMKGMIRSRNPNASIKQKAVLDEIHQASPYLNLMHQQLDGALKDTEASVLALIECINEASLVSRKQADRIDEAKRKGMMLTEAMREQSTYYRDIVIVLNNHVDQQKAELNRHLKSTRCLATLMGELSPLVEAISEIAKQTNLIVINASTEAVRAGAASHGFVEMTDEMRALSSETSEINAHIQLKIELATNNVEADLAFANAAITSHEPLANLKKVIHDISSMESLFNEGCKLQDTLFALDTGNTEAVNTLSETFGYLQFQDILRQRVEQVISAIGELDVHLKGLTTRLEDSASDSHIMPTLKERMECHLDQYVMGSQRDVHTALIGSKSPSDNNLPQIELF